MENFTNKSLGVLVVFLVIVAVVAGLIYLPRSDTGESQEFVIIKGDGSAKVARLLAERDLIRSRRLFIFYTILVGREKEFKAGRYLVSPSMNIPKLVRIFSGGLALSDDTVATIPEGSNVADIVKLLQQAGYQNIDVLAFLPHEGYLFPDTYRFRPDAAVEQIVETMGANFKNKTQGLDVSKEEIIVASMLEKEVRTERDMRLVAGIIYKRLELGMPLEIDATVSYGVCYPKFAAGEHCDVSLANVVDNIPIDSVYNTYRRKGLPAGPIANPGLVAVSSALNPEPSDYLYYLNAKDGTTVFSKTAAEHQRARRKYLGY